MAVKNASPFKIAVNTLEARVVPKPPQDSSKASSSFEGRVVQESGSH